MAERKYDDVLLPFLALMREAHGTTVWPAHWMAVRAQLVAAIRNAGVTVPDGQTFRGSCR